MTNFAAARMTFVARATSTAGNDEGIGSSALGNRPAGAPPFDGDSGNGCANGYPRRNELGHECPRCAHAQDGLFSLPVVQQQNAGPPHGMSADLSAGKLRRERAALPSIVGPQHTGRQSECLAQP